MGKKNTTCGITQSNIAPAERFEANETTQRQVCLPEIRTEIVLDHHIYLSALVNGRGCKAFQGLWLKEAPCTVVPRSFGARGVLRVSNGGAGGSRSGLVRNAIVIIAMMV